MDATLKLTSSTLAYGDLGGTSNPLKRFVDWGVQRQYQVENPKSIPVTLEASETREIFSGVRSTSIAADTEFTLTLSTLSSTRYRFTHSGLTTPPALRTDRALDLSGSTVEVVANANGTASFTSDAASFNGVVVGDVLFFPNTDTGDDASPFNALNTGYWSVLAVALDGSSVTAERPTGTDFTGITEDVDVTAAAQLQAFSAAGVQVGDHVDLSDGFVASILNTYEVVAVNPSWFEVVATQPLPIDEVGVPTTDGIVFYTEAKRYLRIEADQKCVLRLNGDTSNNVRLGPWSAADGDNSAFFEIVGPVWSLSVVNRSSAPLNLFVISAE